MPRGFWFPFKLQQQDWIGDRVGQDCAHDAFQSWRENNPEWLSAEPVRFPFGYDRSGDLFYFHLTGENVGHVFTWIDAALPLEEVDLAASFTEFIAVAGLSEARDGGFWIHRGLGFVALDR